MTSRLLDCSGTEQDYSSPIQLYGTGLLILSSAIPFYHLSKPTLLYNQCDDFYFVLKNFASLAKKPQKLVSKLTNRTLFWKFQKHRNYKPDELAIKWKNVLKNMTFLGEPCIQFLLKIYHQHIHIWSTV